MWNTGSIGVMKADGTFQHLYKCEIGCEGEDTSTPDPFIPDITSPHGITVGPDGNLWFVNKKGGEQRDPPITGVAKSPLGSVGKITTEGDVTIYDHSSINKPNNLTVGPDGNLWFTNSGNDTIGRITTAGDVARFPAVGDDPTISNPKGITAGPDGNLWFVSYGRSDPTDPANTECLLEDPCGISKISTSGVVTSVYSCSTESVSSPCDDKIKEPYDIVTGQDYNLWVTNDDSTRVVRVSTSGPLTLTPYPAAPPSPLAHSYSIAVGGDNAIWFTDFQSIPNKLGRIHATSGTLTTYCDPSSCMPPSNITSAYGVAAGPEGSVYFTDFALAGRVGRATTDYSVTIAPVVGPAGTNLTTLKGAGFDSDEPVTVTYDAATVICPPETTHAGADGTFSCTASIPLNAGLRGIHIIKAKGQTSLTTAKTVFLLTSPT